MKPPYAIGSVPRLSGHAIAYRWRSLPRVCRHRSSKPQGGSERVLPWQITMDQLIFASLSHTHYWYEVGMLKVPAVITLGRILKPLRDRPGVVFLQTPTVCCSMCVCFMLYILYSRLNALAACAPRHACGWGSWAMGAWLGIRAHRIGR